MSAISMKDIRKVVSVGASESNYEVAEFSVEYESSLNFRASIEVSNVVVATGISAKLQHRPINGSYSDLASANASVVIAGNGVVSINLNKENSTDVADMPLHQMCRIVITTGAGDSVDVNRILIQNKA